MKKNHVRLILTSLVILLCSSLLFASTWEGSAVVGSYGDFPESGNFAACNSFARNTLVEVTNLENGQKVTVIITKSLDTPGIFMSLSVEAARLLGIRQGSLTRVRATIPRTTLDTGSSTGTRTLDPDFNPRQLAEAELERLGYLFPETTPAETAPLAVAPVPETVPAPVAETTTAPVAPEPAVPAETASTAQTAPPVVEPPVVAEAQGQPAAPVVPEATMPELAEATDTRLVPPSTIQPRISQVAPEAIAPLRPTSVPPAASTVPVTPAGAAASSTTSVQPQTDQTGKPKPVRTLIIAALPEPQAPAPRTATRPASPAPAPSTAPVAVETPLASPTPAATIPLIAVLPEAVPEVLVRPLPTPDEQELVFEHERSPRRQETLAVLPETYERIAPESFNTPAQVLIGEPAEQKADSLVRPSLQPGQSQPALSIDEPGLRAREIAAAIDRSPGSLGPSATDPMVVLDEPTLRARELAAAIERSRARQAGLGTAISLAELDEPALKARELAAAIERGSYSVRPSDIVLELDEPTAPQARSVELAGVFELAYPQRLDRELSVLLENPDMAPEELPQQFLSWQEAPQPLVPSVDLVDGVLVLKDEERPLAFARETPYFEAVETQVELAVAETKAVEQPSISDRPAQPAAETPVAVPLADAEVMKPAPAVASVVETPAAPAAAPTAAPATAPAAAAETVVTMQPTAPRPPETAARPTAPAATSTPPAITAPAATPAAAAPMQTLQRGLFYIQLAAYSSESAAREAAAGLVSSYSYLIEPVTVRGSRMFRLYAGPFNRDESGLVLMQLRSSGFRDAFVKQGS
ncbi:MAG: SPOR domain-containing protein [Spirochaetes bacterium]|nr:SPOR domain-containing protein [Spirochaetota bacterium]